MASNRRVNSEIILNELSLQIIYKNVSDRTTLPTCPQLCKWNWCNIEQVLKQLKIVHLTFDEESFKNISLLKNIFISLWFAILRLNKYILYVERLSKGTQATKSVK